MTTEKKTIRIGGADGFWGNPGVETPQWVNSGAIGHALDEGLTEPTMSRLASAHLKRPQGLLQSTS